MTSAQQQKVRVSFEEMQPPNFRHADCCLDCKHSEPMNHLLTWKCHRHHIYVDCFKVCDDYEEERNGEG